MRQCISASVWVFVVFLISGIQLQGQDLLITAAGDSINCKVIKQDSRTAFVSTWDSSANREVMLHYHMKDVQSIQRGFYRAKSRDVARKSPFLQPKWRFGVAGGFSHRISIIDDELSPEAINYLKELKSGYFYGGDVSYFFNDNIGIGFRYGVHRSRNAGTLPYEVGDPTRVEYLYRTDKVSIHCINPAFIARFVNPLTGNGFYMGGGLGVVLYENNSSVENIPIRLTGMNVGAMGNLGYDFRINESLGIGIEMVLSSSVLTSVQVTEGGTTRTERLNDDEYESLVRIDLGIGLRWYP